jgi:hypothetical protein
MEDVSTYPPTRASVQGEVYAAYLDGVAAGVRLASSAVDEAIEAALRRPQGRGPDPTARRVSRTHLRVGSAA